MPFMFRMGGCITMHSCSLCLTFISSLLSKITKKRTPWFQNMSDQLNTLCLLFMSPSASPFGHPLYIYVCRAGTKLGKKLGGAKQRQLVRKKVQQISAPPTCTSTTEILHGGSMGLHLLASGRGG